MKQLFLIASLFTTTLVNAQHGIGTRSPSPNAALDVSSTNKGLMLPRLSDTTAVNGPTAGLLIFNSKTKTPAFHNGTTWRSMARLAGTDAIDPNADSIVYSIGPNSASLAAGPFPVESFATGGSTGEDRITANISIPWHINSIGLQKQFMQETVLTGELEVRIFKRGTTTASYTYKFKNITILANSLGHSTGSLIPSISYTVWADKISYKDVANNISFGWSYVAPIGLTTY